MFPQVLRFSDNQLTFLGLDTFHAYPGLQELYMARNRIGMIAPDAFRGLHNLQILDLEGNKLTLIPSSSFKHLTSLRMLSLKSNAVTFIAAGAFEALSNLEKLDLENCWLNRIHPAAFIGLKRLGELNIVNNELSSLSADMEPLIPPAITVLRLHRNPWVCDCRLRWLRRYVSKGGTGPGFSTVSINWDFAPHNTPACDGPELLRGVSWRHLVPDQFACPPTLVVGNGSTSVELLTGTNASIDCMVEGDPEPVIQWMKGTTYVATELTTTKQHAGRIIQRSVERRIHSMLHLSHVTVDDAGDYKCIAINPAGRSEVTYKVWVFEDNPSAAAGAGRKRDNTREIIGKTGNEDSGHATFGGIEIMFGIAVGLTVLIATLFACVVFAVVRKRTVSAQNASHDRKLGTAANNFISSVPKKKLVVELPPEITDIGAVDQLTISNDENLQKKQFIAQEESTETCINKSIDQTIDRCASSSSLTTPVNHVSTVEGKTGEFKMKIFSPATDKSLETSAVCEKSNVCQPDDMCTVSDDQQHNVTANGTDSKPDLLCDEFDNTRDAIASIQVRPRRASISSATVASDAGLSAPENYFVKSQLSTNVSSGAVGNWHCANPVCQRDRFDERLTATSACRHRQVAFNHKPSAGIRSRRCSSDNLTILDTNDIINSADASSSPSSAVYIGKRKGSLISANVYATLPSHRHANACFRTELGEQDRISNSRLVNPVSSLRNGVAGARLPMTSSQVSTIPRHQRVSYNADEQRSTNYTSKPLNCGSSLDSRDHCDIASAVSTSLRMAPSPHSNTAVVTPGFTSTSLNDILKSPFAVPPNGPKKTNNDRGESEQSVKLKPGDQDEFGTAV
jgi:hypothetical protein